MKKIKGFLTWFGAVTILVIVFIAAYSQTGVRESTVNTTTTALNAGNTYTGTYEFNNTSTVAVYLLTDQDGVLYIDFSKEGTNADATLTFNISAGVNEVHNIKCLRPYYRIRITNTSASNQTYLRAGVRLGDFSQSTSSLNSDVQQDQDAVVVRTYDNRYDVVLGKYTGVSSITKNGRNPDVDMGASEDVWNGGGTYTGFPASPEVAEVFSSNAGDNGTLTFTYLASSTSTAYQTATVVLNGTTPVNTGVSVWRVHTAQYSSGSSTAFNLGDITLRHVTTTANIFFVMAAGYSQTNMSGYTVPAGSTAILENLFCNATSTTSSSLTGALWVRTNGSNPRLRRAFSATNTSGYYDHSALSLSAGTDVIVRVITASSNNMNISAGYDLRLVKN